RHCVSCACPLRARPPRSTLSPYTTLFRSHAQKRLDRIADRHNPLALHACALEIASHALVHENEMRWLIVDIEQALPQEMPNRARSEEHTSELQSREKLVCRLLLEKKKHAS